MKQVFILLIGILFTQNISAQLQTTKIHSHNDYTRNYPFWEAFVSGCSSIEIDVILKHDTLYVAHNVNDIVAGKDIERLYFKPLVSALNNGLFGDNRDLQLLIDLKTEALSTLLCLNKVLEKYPQVFNPLVNKNAVRIVISGNKPKAANIHLFNDYITYDLRSPEEVVAFKAQSGLISRNFKDFSVWNGLGRPVEKEYVLVKSFIDSCHALEMPVRFWNAPDTKTAYQSFQQLGVDYINTDKPIQASEFLKNSLTARYIYQKPYSPYIPKFNATMESVPVKNVILIIGDGMGFSQLSAGYLANRGSLTTTYFKSMAFISTSSADNFGTDSAAGATAMATGNKTRNRYIGMDTQGNPLKTLMEIADSLNMLTGIITTDQITGATPASFYAHVTERNWKDSIYQQLMCSTIDLVAGYPAYKEDVTYGKFQLIDSLSFMTNASLPLIYHFSEGDSDRYSSTDGNRLPSVTKHAINALDNKNGFLLMVECGGIDGGGHANDVKSIADEVIHLDQAIGIATAYADNNPGTLVIITADHETGGMVIPEGNSKEGSIEAYFFSNDHTGSWVPLMAYGCKANLFSGMYENTDVFHKIIDLIDKH